MSTGPHSPQTERWCRRWRIHATWGLLAFVVFWAAQPFAGLRAVGGIGYLLVFAAWVVVPLGASLVTRPRYDGGMRLYVVAARAHPLAATAAVAALLLPIGPGAAALAGLWLLQVLLLAGLGASRLARHGVCYLDDLAIDVALLQLPIGAAWWVATCAGWRLGFPDLIVQLTAIHFHYAGFVAPLICGLAGRGVDPERRALRGVYRAACWTVMLANWIVAAGIAVSSIPWVPVWASAPVELAGTVLLATGMICFAGLLCLHLPRQAPRPAAILLAIAGLSLALSMALAVAYAAGRLYGWPLLTIPEMARWHGVLNAFGFAGAGLAGFAWWQPPAHGTRD